MVPVTSSTSFRRLLEASQWTAYQFSVIFRITSYLGTPGNCQLPIDAFIAKSYTSVAACSTFWRVMVDRRESLTPLVNQECPLAPKQRTYYIDSIQKKKLRNCELVAVTPSRSIRPTLSTIPPMSRLYQMAESRSKPRPVQIATWVPVPREIPCTHGILLAGSELGRYFTRIGRRGWRGRSNISVPHRCCPYDRNQSKKGDERQEIHHKGNDN